MKNLCLIAAIGKNNELGYNNDLIWKIKEDLLYFKKLTLNNYIIMGRKTYDSLPKKLKDRKYMVLTSNQDLVFPRDVLVFNNKDEILNFVKDKEDLFFVIGGALIYQMFIDEVDILYLTEIDDSFSLATVFFPSFDKDKFILEKGLDLAENKIKYSHNKYIRKKVKSYES